MTDNDDRSKEYPLFPILSEAAHVEAQQLMDAFKEKFKDIAQEVLGELYCDVALYIESDSWSNFRNEVMAGFKNYNNRKIQDEYDFAEIRQTMLAQYRDQIVADLNQDLVKENEKLKKQIEEEREFNRSHNRY